MSLGKLIRTERRLVVYKRTASDLLGEIVQEINVDSIPLDVLKKIVRENDDDPLLLYGYLLKAEELNQLIPLLAGTIEPDHYHFEYALEAYGIYEK